MSWHRAGMAGPGRGAFPVVIGTLHCPGQRFEVDYTAGIRLGQVIEGDAGSAFFVDQGARREALSGGDFSGRMRTGASCNVDRFEIIPHCHGTHTEGIGHVLEDQPSVLDTADLSPALAQLVTPALQPLPDTGEHYHQPCEAEQNFISRHGLQSLLGEHPGENLDAVLIRTGWPRSGQSYPLLTSEACEWLACSSLKQLLIDTPSLDAETDKSLGNHHRWWGLHAATAGFAEAAQCRSITEFLDIDEGVPDGYYLLHTAVAALASDASLSQPVIYPLSPC